MCAIARHSERYYRIDVMQSAQVCWAMDNDKRLHLDVYPTRELLLRLDRWRIEQPDAPARAEAARRLLDEVLPTLAAQVKQSPARKRQKAAA
jgi:hypothetical protein